MPVLGSIETYDGIDKFDYYIERLEHYFVANFSGDFPTSANAEVIQSVEKKKIYFFLTIIGRDAYKIAQTLCSTKVPGDYNYNELITFLKSITLQFDSKLPSHSNLENVFRKTVNL